MNAGLWGRQANITLSSGGQAGAEWGKVCRRSALCVAVLITDSPFVLHRRLHCTQDVCPLVPAALLHPPLQHADVPGNAARRDGRARILCQCKLSAGPLAVVLSGAIPCLVGPIDHGRGPCRPPYTATPVCLQGWPCCGRCAHVPAWHPLASRFLCSCEPPQLPPTPWLLRYRTLPGCLASPSLTLSRSTSRVSACRRLPCARAAEAGPAGTRVGPRLGTLTPPAMMRTPRGRVSSLPHHDAQTEMQAEASRLHPPQAPRAACLLLAPT